MNSIDPTPEIELQNLRQEQSRDTRMLAVLLILHELVESMPQMERAKLLQRLQESSTMFPECFDGIPQIEVGRFKSAHRSKQKFQIVLELFLSFFKVR